MYRSFVCIVLAAALALNAAAVASPATAQPSDSLRLNLGYDGRLLFVKVLDIRLQEDVGRTEHASTARISSYGVLDAFKRVHVDAQESGRIVRGDPAPGVFRHQNLDGKDNREVEVTWEPNDVVTQASPEWTSRGDPPATREQRLSAVGYLTAVARLTVTADKGPCTGSERIFNGKELSEIGFSNPRPAAMTEAEKALGLINGVRCDATFREIAGYKKKTGKARNQGLDRPIEVDFAQIGAEGPWVAARLSARTILGPAVITLARVKMEGHLPEGIVASRAPSLAGGLSRRD